MRHVSVMTPQLMEVGSEFQISEDEEGWIVSMDNSIVLIMSVLSGILQTKFGPMKVNRGYFLDPLTVKQKLTYRFYGLPVFRTSLAGLLLSAPQMFGVFIYQDSLLEPVMLC